jgi:predicted chitinase
MDRAKFFAGLRSRDSGVFGTSLSQAQVDGIEAILDACTRRNVTDPHHVSNVLAQVYHETGGHRLGIKETVMPGHKDKNPSDATVIARLEAAWKAGKLPWVKTPYWRDGAFGRGPIMLTHWANYDKFAKRLGVPLRQKPELALDPKIGADIAVVGMSEGMFTGRKLSDYQFPAALDAIPASNPRRIVNGQDGTDVTVAGYHRAFHRALIAAGYQASPPAPGAQPAPAPEPPIAQPTSPLAEPAVQPAPPPTQAEGLWAAVLAIITKLIGKGA